MLYESSGGNQVDSLVAVYLVTAGGTRGCARRQGSCPPDLGGCGRAP